MYITPRLDILADVQDVKQETKKTIKAMKINAVMLSKIKSLGLYFFIKPILNIAKIGRKKYI